MAVKLENCTEEEQRSMMCFLWAKGWPSGPIHFTRLGGRQTNEAN
jgi:hypothetical protein